MIYLNIYSKNATMCQDVKKNNPQDQSSTAKQPSRFRNFFNVITVELPGTLKNIFKRKETPTDIEIKMDNTSSFSEEQTSPIKEEEKEIFKEEQKEEDQSYPLLDLQDVISIQIDEHIKEEEKTPGSVEDLPESNFLNQNNMQITDKEDDTDGINYFIDQSPENRKKLGPNNETYKMSKNKELYFEQDLMNIHFATQSHERSLTALTRKALSSGKHKKHHSFCMIKNDMRRKSASPIGGALTFKGKESPRQISLSKFTDIAKALDKANQEADLKVVGSPKDKPLSTINETKAHIDEPCNWDTVLSQHESKEYSHESIISNEHKKSY